MNIPRPRGKLLGGCLWTTERLEEGREYPCHSTQTKARHVRCQRPAPSVATAAATAATAATATARTSFAATVTASTRSRDK